MAEFVVIGQNIVNAMTNEELENQSNSTNVSNVYFDAYFKDGENTKHSKEIDCKYKCKKYGEHRKWKNKNKQP